MTCLSKFVPVGWKDHCPFTQQKRMIKGSITHSFLHKMSNNRCFLESGNFSTGNYFLTRAMSQEPNMKHTSKFYNVKPNEIYHRISWRSNVKMSKNLWPVCQCSLLLGERRRPHSLKRMKQFSGPAEKRPLQLNARDTIQVVINVPFRKIPSSEEPQRSKLTSRVTRTLLFRALLNRT